MPDPLAKEDGVAFPRRAVDAPQVAFVDSVAADPLAAEYAARTVLDRLPLAGHESLRAPLRIKSERVERHGVARLLAPQPSLDDRRGVVACQPSPDDLIYLVIARR